MWIAGLVALGLLAAIFVVGFASYLLGELMHDDGPEGKPHRR